MIVRDIDIVERAGGVALKASVRPESGGAAPFELEYFVRGGRSEWLAQTGDPFVAPLLQLAMARHEPLHIDGSVSPRLLRSVPTIMDIYEAWRPGVSRIDVIPASVATPRPPEKSCGLFFSGGVDSCYSLLKSDDPARSAEQVTHLLLVLGFDIPLNNRPVFEQLAARVAGVAERAGKQLIVVESNIRTLSDPIARWGYHCGAALSGVGLALGGLLGRVIIASSYAWQELHPWGSHPLLDPLWSSDGVEIIHDGCEATRLQKVRNISTSDLALSSLRVCWLKDNTAYNCGECEKCLRTMIALHVAGAMGRCPTFARPLNPEAIRRIRVSDASSEVFLVELLDALGSSPTDRQLARALRSAIRASRRRTQVGRFVRNHVGAWATLPGLRRAVHALRSGEPQAI